MKRVFSLVQWLLVYCWSPPSHTCARSFLPVGWLVGHLLARSKLFVFGFGFVLFVGPVCFLVCVCVCVWECVRVGVFSLVIVCHSNNNNNNNRLQRRRLLVRRESLPHCQHTNHISPALRECSCPGRVASYSYAY